MPPSKHHKVSNSGKEVSVLVVDLISSRVPIVCDDQRNKHAQHTYIYLVKNV